MAEKDEDLPVILVPQKGWLFQIHTEFQVSGSRFRSWLACKKTPRWIKRAAGEVIEKGTALSVPLTMGNNVTPILEQSKGELGLVIKDPKSISRPHTLSQGN